MNLTPLRTTPYLSVYFDTWNNWLFAEWEGDLTLPIVQHACLELVRCYLSHAYPRVLNSNVRVRSATADVAPWLAAEFLPALELAGVEQVAWVCGTTLQSRNMAYDTQYRLPHIALALFDNIDEAVAWLQQTRPAYGSGSRLVPAPLVPSEKLARAIGRLGEQLEPVGV